MIKVGSFKMDDPTASQQQGAANNDPSPPRSTPPDGDRPAQGSGSLQIDMQQIQAAEARSESDETPPQVTDTFTFAPCHSSIAGILFSESSGKQHWPKHLI